MRRARDIGLKHVNVCSERNARHFVCFADVFGVLFHDFGAEFATIDLGGIEGL